jgi:oxalate---CoA ligase
LLPVLTPLLTGGSVAFPVNNLRIDLLEWLTTLMPTWYSAAPTLHISIFEQLESQASAKISHSLRFVLTSGAPLPQRRYEALHSILGVPVLDHYGASETQLISTNRPPPGPCKPETCGIPWPNTVKIVGEDGRQLDSGEHGEILVGGSTVISAYLNATPLNQAAFTHGWFRTGDVGSIDEDGFLSLHGRQNELINRGGEKIAPHEIDSALMRHPQVAEAAAYAVPHLRLGEDVASTVARYVCLLHARLDSRGRRLYCQ